MPQPQQDQYGNYVIQHVIQYGRPDDRAAVLRRVRSELFAFAQVVPPLAT